MAVISTLAVSIRARADQFLSAMRKVRSAVSAVVGAFSRMTKAITPVFLALTGLTGISLVALINQTRKLGDEVGKLSDEIGIEVNQLFALRTAAELTGTTTAILTTALQRMNRRIGEAVRGYGEGVKALTALGLAASDLASLGAFEQFKVISDRVAELGTQALKAGDSYALFGRQGSKLINMFQLQSEGLDEILKRTERLMGPFTREDLRPIEAMNDMIVEMKSALSGLSLRALIGLAPKIASIIDAMTEGFIRFREKVLPSVIKMQSRLFDLMLKGIEKVLPVIFTVGIFLREMARRGITSLKTVAQGFSALAAKITETIDLVRASSTEAAALLDVFNVKDATDLFAFIGVGISNIITSLLDGIILIGKAIPGLLTAIIRAYKEVGRTYIVLMEGMYDITETTFTAIAEIVSAAFDPRKSIKKAILESTDLWSTQWHKAAQDLETQMNKVSFDALGKEVDKLWESFGELGVEFSDKMEADMGTWKRLQKQMSSFFDGLRDFELTFDIPQIEVNPEDRKLLKKLFAPVAEFGSQAAQKIIAQSEGIKPPKIPPLVIPEIKLDFALPKDRVTEDLNAMRRELARNREIEDPSDLLIDDTFTKDFNVAADRLGAAVGPFTEWEAAATAVSESLQNRKIFQVLETAVKSLRLVGLTGPADRGRFDRATFDKVFDNVVQAVGAGVLKAATPEPPAFLGTPGQDRDQQKANEAIPEQNKILSDIRTAVRDTPEPITFSVMTV